MNTFCNTVTIQCLHNVFVKDKQLGKGDILFSGLIIKDGEKRSFVGAPYRVRIEKDTVSIVCNKGVEYYFRISQTKYNEDSIKSLFVDCNCCATESGNDTNASPVLIPVPHIGIQGNEIYYSFGAIGDDRWIDMNPRIFLYRYKNSVWSTNKIIGYSGPTNHRYKRGKKWVHPADPTNQDYWRDKTGGRFFCNADVSHPVKTEWDVLTGPGEGGGHKLHGFNHFGFWKDKNYLNYKTKADTYITHWGQVMQVGTPPLNYPIAAWGSIQYENAFRIGGQKNTKFLRYSSTGEATNVRLKHMRQFWRLRLAVENPEYDLADYTKGPPVFFSEFSETFCTYPTKQKDMYAGVVPLMKVFLVPTRHIKKHNSNYGFNAVL